MNKITINLCAALCLLAPGVYAEQQAQGALLKQDNMSIGIGIARNSVDSVGNDNSEIGFQFFGAYDLNQVKLIEGARSSIELGYMDYGFDGRDTGGLWTTFVLDGVIRENLGWLARLGLGDDSGLMLGAGVGFRMNSVTQLRVEYVIRDDIDSLQFNLIYHL
jgi:hypothetical protein